MTNEELTLWIEDRLTRQLAAFDERVTGISRALERATAKLEAHADNEGPRKIHHTPPCGWSEEHLAAHRAETAARDKAQEDRRYRRGWRLGLLLAACTVVGTVGGAIGTFAVLQGLFK